MFGDTEWCSPETTIEESGGCMPLLSEEFAAKCATYIIVDPLHVDLSAPIYDVVYRVSDVSCVGVMASIDMNTVSVGTSKFVSVKSGRKVARHTVDFDAVVVVCLVGMICVAVSTDKVRGTEGLSTAVAGNVFIVSSCSVESTDVGKTVFVSAAGALAGPANAAEVKEESSV